MIKIDNWCFFVSQDLIDDNPIEEDSDAENSDGSRRQKRKSRSDDELDDRLEDDDYDLLEENLGVKVQRRVRRLYKQHFRLEVVCSILNRDSHFSANTRLFMKSIGNIALEVQNHSGDSIFGLKHSIPAIFDPF